MPVIGQEVVDEGERNPLQNKRRIAKGEAKENSLQPKVEEELKKLEKTDIISKFDLFM